MEAKTILCKILIGVMAGKAIVMHDLPYRVTVLVSLLTWSKHFLAEAFSILAHDATLLEVAVQLVNSIFCHISSLLFLSVIFLILYSRH